MALKGNTMLEPLFWLTTAAVVHHHITYPLSLLSKPLAKTRNSAPREFPAITILVTAYREGQSIADKIANLAALDYPDGLVDIKILCDGSPDDTPGAARRAISVYGSDNKIFEVIEHRVNRGKVVVLNEAISGAETPVVVLTDASAEVQKDALFRVAMGFANSDTGVVGGIYDCKANGTAGERRYWDVQNRLRLGEAAFGSPMGFSGAFYAIRREAFEAMPEATINDDFVLPMRIVSKGWWAVLDPRLVIHETERTRPGQEWARRVRIGAGNVQQALQLASLANPVRPGIAYAFVSGKGLRAFMPFLLLVMIVSAVALSLSSSFFAILSGWIGLGTIYALYSLSLAEVRRSRLQAMAATLLSGYLANGIGAIAWLTGRFDHRGQWTAIPQEAEKAYLPSGVLKAKRLFDLIGATGLLLVLAIVYIPVVLAIKLESKGPVFYRQLRVGRALSDRTTLFELIKFRTMRSDAEANGAAWAKKGDSRITRVGRFLRKTRLDELPQAINILRGEMSLVGPRPERPVFFNKLEGSIPLYIERTYGILPGVTGLAQVNQGYDESIEDVRSKVGWDHAYALQLESPWSWLKADLSIALATIGVMVGRKGQ